MNVTSIGQGSGGVATLPGPQTTGQPAVERGPNAANVTRLAWFDVNGDGHIDDRSPFAGGDGTLIVPQHAAHPLYSRQVRRDSIRPQHEHTSEPKSDRADAQANAHADPAANVPVAVTPVAPSVVQTRAAIDAYQRYGQPSSDNTQPERAVA